MRTLYQRVRGAEVRMLYQRVRGEEWRMLYQRVGGGENAVPESKGSGSENAVPESKESRSENAVATKFNKIVNYFSFEVLKEKNLGQFSKNYRTFYQKNCQKALQNMVLGSGIRDPGSGKNPFRIPDPGVKKAPDPGSRIPYPDPQHWCLTWDEVSYHTHFQRRVVWNKQEIDFE